MHRDLKRAAIALAIDPETLETIIRQAGTHWPASLQHSPQTRQMVDLTRDLNITDSPGADARLRRETHKS